MEPTKTSYAVRSYFRLVGICLAEGTVPPTLSSTFAPLPPLFTPSLSRFIPLSPIFTRLPYPVVATFLPHYVAQKLC